MAGRSINELLAPEVILREVSRVLLPGTVLSDLFGWGLANRDPANMNGNMIDWQLRDGKYDVFNRLRRLATASVPGSPQTLVAPKPVGKVSYTIPRTAEQIALTDEEIHNRRVTGQNANIVDVGGENYIMRQKMGLAERVANMIEFQTAAMLRGSYSFDQVGDELRHCFSGGEDTIDFQIPASNKNQLGGIIGTSWATTTTDIPGDFYAMNLASNDLSGRGLEHVVLNSNTYQYLLKNDFIKAQAGTANTPFESLNRTGAGTYGVVFKAIPQYQFHVIDYSLEIWDGSSAFATTRLIADDQVSVFPTPDPSWVQYLNGGEWITEGPNGARAFHYGFYAYGYPNWNPSGWNLCVNHNGFPGLWVPGAIYTADVTP